DIYYHISDARYNYIKNPLERIRKIRDYMFRTKKPKFKSLLYPIYVVLFSKTHKKVNYNFFVQNGGRVASIFIICDSSEKANRVRERLTDIKDIDISSSGKNNIEILDKRATKGHSLKKIASILGIPLSEVVAVGDHYNDLTMIRYAGLGVAMENGEEEIKRNADWITKSNEEDGVADLIYKKIIPPEEIMFGELM
ncbi:MAG TPA: HAD hydrolase family protein, partial [Clostridia bacterium]|nr:HAD hydrolase family protein [Clostridia bacterium]